MYENPPLMEAYSAVINGDPMDDYLEHYGMPRRSGRYPWGSGENPYQHSGDFLARVADLRKENFTYTDENGKVWTGDTAIAKSMGLTSGQFRTQMSLANAERRSLDVATAKGLREKGYSLPAIAREMGLPGESSVRSLLNENSEARMNQAQKTAEFLKKQIEEKGMIDVGAGVERELNISKERLKQALYILEMEGYPTYGGGVSQATNPGKQTNMQILCPPGTEHKEIFEAMKENKIANVGEDYVSHDGGETFDPKWVYPKSMDSNRLQIRYAEDGGVNKDGVIELRRGVDDLDLGGSHYAQVRILVDGDRYLKGMAVYSDNMPDGVDVVFNTNKTSKTPKMEVLKKIHTEDPNNPFGSLIKEGIVDPDNPLSDKKGGQSYYYDKNGKKQLSLINKRAEEGDWGDWKDKLPAQFLAKQNISLVKKQLKLTTDEKISEYNEICSLTNPTVKKRLLQSFSDDCDSAAVHLQAVSLPRQKYQVILPLTSIKDTEIYAPNYINGEKVALVRFPHGGTFEIPVLTVNNKNKEGISTMSERPMDAVGISKAVADRLSGADFDGDTVMVIPTNSKTKITSTKSLDGLKDFDTKISYGPDSSEPVKVVEDSKGKKIEYYSRNGKTYQRMRNTQNEMGRISNLITDMTIKGADVNELAAAVRHSMVVIDAEKHKLDYKQSYLDNNIATLKKKYQGEGGASTLISRAKGEYSVPKRQGSPNINQKGKPWYDPSKPEGALIYKTTDKLYYVDANGKTVKRTQASTQMAETDDARTLSSGHPVEEVYAEYANTMKSLANQARKEMVYAGKIQYNAQAKSTYREEVNSLNAKLNIALKNAPRERKAQVMAKAQVEAMKTDNPDMTKAEIKKASQRALASARVQVGAQRRPVDITPKEWEAIQAGAVSENVLTKILNNTDIDKVRQYATPRESLQLSTAKINRIRNMEARGYTTAEIADAVGVSSSTVSKYLS